MKAKNVALDYKNQARTYRLNRGALTQVPGAPAIYSGFDVASYTHTVSHFRHTQLEGQLVPADLVPQNGGFRPDGLHPNIFNLWLASPKTTEALFIAANAIPQGLWIGRVSGTRTITSVRAAAVSASFLLIHRAALDLDIDPEEFDIVDPRTHLINGNRVPVLQFTDHLVNGSGFCERLFRPGSSATPLIVQIMNSIVTDREAFPLKDYRPTVGPDHARNCFESCYICLQRYGNQPYHGLLDWRLGLSFLEALNDETFQCGLDGNFKTPSLEDWPQLATRYAQDLIRNYRGASGEIRALRNGITAFRFDRTKDHWAIVTHPLWDTDNPVGILQDAIVELGSPPEFADTFELSRRQVTARERLVQLWL